MKEKHNKNTVRAYGSSGLPLEINNLKSTGSKETKVSNESTKSTKSGNSESAIANGTMLNTSYILLNVT